jgi:hypothetical protein
MLCASLITAPNPQPEKLNQQKDFDIEVVQ